MFENVASFLGYFENVRRRTLKFCSAVPESRIDWAPKPGDFTCGDIVRHIAASEQMFASVALTGLWAYPGHERMLGSTLRGALAFLDAGHTSAVAALGTLSDGALVERRDMIGDHMIEIWHVLILMVEHEIHHRSQIGSYLNLMGVKPPQLYGLRLEEVIAYSEGQRARARG